MLFRSLFSEDAAFRFREIYNGKGGVSAALCFFDGMANSALIAESIAEPISSLISSGGELTSESVLSTVTNCELKEARDLEMLS